MVLFSREPIEFETAAYLSVCVMEKSIYVSAGGWDKSFYDDGVMNSQNNNNNEKSADPIFKTKSQASPTNKAKECVCVLSLFFVRFSPFFRTTKRLHTQQNTP